MKINTKALVFAVTVLMISASVIALTAGVGVESALTDSNARKRPPPPPPEPVEWNKADLTPMMPWWNDVIDVEKQSYTGAGSVVVIIDTGLVAEWRNYFPEENILTEYCRSFTQELGKDSVAYDADTEGHGTACTGTIIGYRLDSDEGYWINGVAEDAKIVMLRCLYWVGGQRMLINLFLTLKLTR